MQCLSDYDLQELESRLYSQVYHLDEDWNSNIIAPAFYPAQQFSQTQNKYTVNNVFLPPPNINRYWIPIPIPSCSATTTQEVEGNKDITPTPTPIINENPTTTQEVEESKQTTPTINETVRRKRKRKKNRQKRINKSDSLINSLPPISSYANSHFLDAVDLTKSNSKRSKQMCEIAEVPVDEIIIVSDENETDDEVVEVPLPPKPPVPVFSVESSDDEKPHRNQEEETKRKVEQERIELLFTPDSNTNDFIENDVNGANLTFNFQLHGLDVDLNNTEVKTSKQVSCGELYETESSCSDVTVFSKPVENQRKEIFVEPDLEQFSDFITPNRMEKNCTNRIETKALNAKKVNKKKKRMKKLNKKMEKSTLSDILCSQSDENETEKLNSSYKELNDFSFVKAWDEIQNDDPPQSGSDPKNQTQSSEIEVQQNKSSSPVSNEAFIEFSESSVIKMNVTKSIEKKNKRTLVPNPMNILNLKKKWTYSHFWTSDMNKFYNDSWGQENYDINKVHSIMSSDMSKWPISSEDTCLYSRPKKGPLCLRCRERGHTSSRCPRYQGQPNCSICGRKGHPYTRCPNVLCTNCGKKGSYHTTSCRNCAHFNRIRCLLCKCIGHKTQNCPDLWRRYHLTTEESSTLIKPKEKLKPVNERWCSNCAKRGHLNDKCNYLKSEHFVTNPEVISYIPTYDNPLNFLPVNAPDTEVPELENTKLSEIREYKDKLIETNKRNMLDLREKYKRNLQTLRTKCEKFNPDLLQYIEHFQRRLTQAIRRPQFDKKQNIKVAFYKLQSRIERNLYNH